MAKEHYTPKQGGPLREGTWVAGCSLEKHNLFIELSPFCFSKIFEHTLCLLWCLFMVFLDVLESFCLREKKKKHTDISCPGCYQDLLVVYFCLGEFNVFV